MASAHVELISSSPEAGANLDSAPTEVTVTFDDEVDPDHSTFTVTDADGNEVGSGEVDLTVADRNVLRGDVSVSDPGVYTVNYTVAGVDGHEIDGTFSFGYNTEEAIPEPTGGEHEDPGHRTAVRPADAAARGRAAADRPGRRCLACGAWPSASMERPAPWRAAS